LRQDVDITVKALRDWYNYLYNCLDLQKSLKSTCIIYVYHLEKLKLLNVAISETKWSPFDTAQKQNLDQRNISGWLCGYTILTTETYLKSSANKSSHGKIIGPDLCSTSHVYKTRIVQEAYRTVKALLDWYKYAYSCLTFSKIQKTHPNVSYICTTLKNANFEPNDFRSTRPKYRI
jgi:hypothetical protein